MTELSKRLEAAGSREAEKYSKWYSGHINQVFDFEKGHTHLHPLIQKMAEALEWYANPCGSCEKNWEFTCHGSPKKARDAIAELEKYLGGV